MKVSRSYIAGNELAGVTMHAHTLSPGGQSQGTTETHPRNRSQSYGGLLSLQRQ